MPMLNAFHRDSDTIRHFWSSELLYAPTDSGQESPPRRHHRAVVQPARLHAGGTSARLGGTTELPVTRPPARRPLRRNRRRRSGPGFGPGTVRLGWVIFRLTPRSALHFAISSQRSGPTFPRCSKAGLHRTSPPTSCCAKAIRSQARSSSFLGHSSDSPSDAG